MTFADPLGCIEGDWGFWDETWSNWFGGFTDEAAARAGLRAYAKYLEDGLIYYSIWLKKS